MTRAYLNSRIHRRNVRDGRETFGYELRGPAGWRTPHFHSSPLTIQYMRLTTLGLASEAQHSRAYHQLGRRTNTSTYVLHTWSRLIIGASVSTSPTRLSAISCVDTTRGVPSCSWSSSSRIARITDLSSREIPLARMHLTNATIGTEHQAGFQPSCSGETKESLLHQNTPSATRPHLGPKRCASSVPPSFTNFPLPIGTSSGIMKHLHGERIDRWW